MIKPAIETAILLFPGQTHPGDLQKVDFLDGISLRSASATARETGCEAIIVFTGSSPDMADCLKLIETAAADWPSMSVGTYASNEPKGIRERFSDLLIRMESGISIPESPVCIYLFPIALFEQRFISKGAGFMNEAVVRGGWAGLPLFQLEMQTDRQPATSAPAGSRPVMLPHIWLLLRSLLPWPHKRIRQRKPAWKAMKENLNPLHFFRNLSQEHNSPLELAVAVWMGIFIGALPIIPFGIATIIYVNHRLHLNKLAGVGASNLCIAPFVPFACIQVGHFIRYGRLWNDFNSQTLLFEIHQRIWEWLIGAMVIGPLIGFAGAVLTFWLVRGMRKREGKSSKEYGECP